MIVDEFNVILDDTLDTVDKVMRAKRREYAGDHDVLHNFKNASFQFPMGAGDSPGMALLGMARKHWTSIYDIVAGNTPATREIIAEKIGDAINYLILLKAWLLERHSKQARDISPLEIAQ